MSGIVLPIDASGGSPAFPAADHRVAQAAMLGAGNGRKLGARSGFRPGSEPTVSVTSTQWTVGACAGVLDPETAQTVGPYLFAFKANEVGPINAADGTNQRIDRLDVQAPDDPPGASPRAGVIVYTAGNPATPNTPPVAPARSTPVGTITVPKVGGGSPSFVPTWQWAVASGGIVPVRPGVRPASPYSGQYVDDPSFGLLRFDGPTSQWRDDRDRGDIGASANLDTFTAPGTYTATSTTTGPINYRYTLTVENATHPGGVIYVRQQFTVHGGNPSPAGMTWVRSRDASNVWSAWRCMTPPAGSSSLSHAANTATGTATVPLGVTLPAAPTAVMVTSTYAQSFGLRVTAKTPTNFTVSSFPTSGSNPSVTHTVTFDWVAFP